MQAAYDLAPVIADVISAHCPGTSARQTFIRAFLGDWVEAKCMVEGMLAEPWLLRGYQEARLRDPGTPSQHTWVGRVPNGAYCWVNVPRFTSLKVGRRFPSQRSTTPPQTSQIFSPLPRNPPGRPDASRPSCRPCK